MTISSVSYTHRDVYKRQAYIYGYDQSLPIAVVRNAMTYETPEDYTPSIRQEIFYTSFEEDTASQVKILPLAKTGRKACLLYTSQFVDPGQRTERLRERHRRDVARYRSGI